MLRRTCCTSIDLAEVGKILDGTIPAVIEEVVKRAKLAQLKLQPRHSKVELISSEALVISAKSMQEQVKILEDASKVEAPEPTFNEVMREAIAPLVESTSTKVDKTSRQVAEIHERFV